MSISDINRIMRNTIIDISGLEGNFVRDATTEYGADLDKNPSGSIFYSISPEDTLILFELSPSDVSANMSEKNITGNGITYYMYFDFDIKMYGDNSIYDSLLLAAKFRSEEIRDSLIAQGIHLARVSNIRKIEEFINGMIWMRNDFTIQIGCELSITKAKDPYEIDAYNEIYIYKNRIKEDD